MLVSFAVSNFRSFLKEQQFSLVASKRLGLAHPTHAVPIPRSDDERVLRAAVLYGANGAGKSNLFRALSFLKNIVLEPRSANSGTGREAFRFSDNNATTDFDIQFIAEDKLYRLGLKLSDSQVSEEWLVEITGSREKIIYERSTNMQGAVTVEAPSLNPESKRLKALATVGGPENQSFLATIRATLKPADISKDLNAVLDWFDNGLTLVAPDEGFAPLGTMLAHEPEFLTFASNFLKAASTGIDSLHVIKSEITEDEVKRLLPKNVLAEVHKGFLENKAVNATLINQDENLEIFLEKTPEDHFYKISVQASHKNDSNKIAHLELSEESDGTQRLLSLLPALHQLKNKNAVFVIDEIDRSLHPKLSYDFLNFFLESCTSGHQQIIVTTHECNLLDLDLLRRDEIWFAEKDYNGETHLTSLSDFKVRNDLDVRKHYMEGRFGGVPFLGNLQRLLEN